MTHDQAPKPQPLGEARPQKRPQPHPISPATDDITHTKNTFSAPQQLSPRPPVLAFHHVTDEM